MSARRIGPLVAAAFAVAAPLAQAQRRAVEASKSALERTQPLDAPIVTDIVPATTSYPAEEYHQDYYRKNPVRYKLYRTNCGRDARLTQLWGEQAGSPR